jgi:magnesium-transporting ATPase (P-type)
MADVSTTKITADDSDDHSANSGNEDENSDDEEFEDENSLKYLPNELNFTARFLNDEADLILSGDNDQNKTMFVEFFRGIALCHQCNVIKDKQVEKDENNIKYVGVLHDELATLNFARQQNFKLVQRGKKMMTLLLQGN